MSKEIEKKFELEKLPSREILDEGVDISQGYIFDNNGEMRVRQKEQKFFITVKGDGTLTRNEWEEEIPKWAFEIIWEQTVGKRVEKKRYVVIHNGFTLEIDEYFGDLTGLFTMECEFKSEEAVESFQLPDWACSARDVTEDKRYKNKNLAIKGRPKN